MGKKKVNNKIVSLALLTSVGFQIGSGTIGAFADEVPEASPDASATTAPTTDQQQQAPVAEQPQAPVAEQPQAPVAEQPQTPQTPTTDQQQQAPVAANEFGSLPKQDVSKNPSIDLSKGLKGDNQEKSVLELKGKKDKLDDKKVGEDKANPTDKKKAVTTQEKIKQEVQSKQDSINHNTAGLGTTGYESSNAIGEDFSQGGVSVSKGVVATNTVNFVKMIGKDAQEVSKKHKIYASVMIAQAILESASGSSTLSQAPHNNLFGIKGEYNGHSTNMSTQEDDGSGSLYTINAGFRSYPTVRDSLNDYGNLIEHGIDGASDYYSGVLKKNTANFTDATRALQGTYATDTNYANKLNGIIATYNLTRFDKDELTLRDLAWLESSSEDVDTPSYGSEQYTQAPKNVAVSIQAEKGHPVADSSVIEVANGGVSNGAKPTGTITPAANASIITKTALKYIGTPYVWGGKTPSGWDCSGFVGWVVREATGHDISQWTVTQEQAGVTIPADEAQEGDLLFWGEHGATTHVALSIGNGQYIHAPQPGETVKIGSSQFWAPSFAVRLNFN